MCSLADTKPQRQRQRQPHLHVIIFPFLAQGHLVPAVPLALRFASRTFTTVSLVSTPRNAERLRAFLPADAPVRVHSLAFHAPDHGLPADGENLDSLPVELHLALLRATLCLREPLRNFLSDIRAAVKDGDSPRMAVLADPPYGWAVEVAREFGATHAVVGAFPAYSSAVYCALWRHLPHLHMAEGEQEFHLPGFPETTTFRVDQITDEIRHSDGTDEFLIFMREQFRLTEASDAFVSNTVEELDREGIRLFQENEKLRVWPVGPLLHLSDPKSPQEQRAGRKTTVSAQTCKEWLGAHPPASVLYISFGSQYAISAQQMMALAVALETSGVAFVWVLRPPAGFDIREEFHDEWLPPRFESRVTAAGRGLLVRRWAPQMDILSHPSTGGFFCHCGWNSTLESFISGVPIIAWPLACEQFFNTKIAEDLGVCIELGRGLRNEMDVGKASMTIMEVVGGKKGEVMRQKAKEVAETVKAATVEERGEDGVWKKGSSVVALEGFIQFALERQVA